MMKIPLVCIVCAAVTIGFCSQLSVAVTPFVDLDIPKYMGVWYEALRIPNDFEKGMDCAVSTYIQTSDKQFVFRGKARTRSGKIVKIGGTSTMVSPGVFEVEMEGYPRMNYTVLGTDYETYNCEFSSYEDGDKTKVYGWISTREVPASEEAIKRALNVFEKNGVDTTLFRRVYQGDECGFKRKNRIVY